MNSHESSGRRVEAHTTNANPDQVDQIIRYFGRHAAEVIDVSVDYDLVTRELRVSGEPADVDEVELARLSLTEAIRAAQSIHPSDNLDMSA